MSHWAWLLVAGSLLLLTYAAFAATLLALGRRWDVAEVAHFVPDCVVFLRRLTRDLRLPRHLKLLLIGLLAYLAMPFATSSP